MTDHRPILIVSTCMDPLSELEFVKPLKSLLQRHGEKPRVVHYKRLDSKSVAKASKIIMSGTSLKDFDYLNHIDKFDWIPSVDIPVLGICAGSQVLGIIMGESLTETLLIGKHAVDPSPAKGNKEAMQLLPPDPFEAYFLNSRCIANPSHFKVWATTVSGTPAVFKHERLPFIGCLFHPELLNPEILVKFTKLY